MPFSALSSVHSSNTSSPSSVLDPLRSAATLYSVKDTISCVCLAESSHLSIHFLAGTVTTAIENFVSQSSHTYIIPLRDHSLQSYHPIIS